MRDDMAAPAEDFGKRSNLDQAGVAQASIEFWTAGPVTVEPAGDEATNSQNTLRSGRPSSGPGGGPRFARDLSSGRESE